MFIFFFFNDTATTEIYTLSLHDALPIFGLDIELRFFQRRPHAGARSEMNDAIIIRLSECFRERRAIANRSEEHTSELQSQSNLVCRLLLEKKKKINTTKQNHQITHI